MGPEWRGTGSGDGSGGRPLLPVVRRAMQFGLGPPALVRWLRARGVESGRPDWTAADERLARAMARRLDDVMGPYAAAADGGNWRPPLTYQPQDTVAAQELRV